VLGDFNLHHPFWGGIARPLQHRMADQLLDLVGHFALDLATPVGTRTRSGKGQESTIDLAFTTSSITPIIEHCYTRDELDQASDHWPISLKLSLKVEESTPIRKRAWKHINQETFTKTLECQNIQLPPLPTTHSIDEYLEQILHALNVAIEAAVPWRRPNAKSKGFWNNECTQIVRKARQLRRFYTESQNEQDWDNYTTAVTEKKRTIRKASTRSFRE
jgi:hypothetical protein